MTWESLQDVLTRLEAGTPPPPWAGLFGANLRPEDADLVLIPVPWDATVSYGDGTANGPEAVLRASHQLDLEDPAFGQPYRRGITMLPEDPGIRELNIRARAAAIRVIANELPADELMLDLKLVNRTSDQVNHLVERFAQEQLAAGKMVGVLGGDHSSPFGLIKAIAGHDASAFGVLHVDAHHDLREAYEGFAHSHASIMHNVLTEISSVTHLAQVGIRDYSLAEQRFAQGLGKRASVHYDHALNHKKAHGESWAQIVAEIIAPLPKRVYISFDIDGLDPALCPSTGTPVPGGLSYGEAIFLIEAVVKSGRKIVGFDLCEVAPASGNGPQGEWDANVGARILYKLCGAILASAPRH